MKRGAAVAAILLLTKAAHAAPCIAVETGEVLDPAGRARLVEQLLAAFGEHGIDACTADRKADALAAMSIEASGRSSVTIRVRDAVTQKEVARTVSLASTPRDGRALAVALAADELLRATWAEIALRPPPAPAPPTEVAPIAPPPAVRDVVAASISPAIATSIERRRVIAVDLAGAGEHATGGHDQAGIDVRAAAWLTARFALSLRLGARVSPRTYATDGAADATALMGGIGAAFALTPHERRVGIDVPLRIDGERLDYGARPGSGARGANASALAVVMSTGVSSWLSFSATWGLVAEVTAGYVVRPVEARDAGSTFTALSGAQIGASISLRAMP